MSDRFPPAQRRILVVWFLAALLLRGGVIWKLADNLNRDTDGYRRLAQNMVRHGVYGFHGVPNVAPSAFRPPLYPLLLTTGVRHGILSLGWVAMLHALLGAATVAGVYAAARNCGLRWGAHAAALAVLFDPILVLQSSQIMTETLAAALVIATLLALQQAVRREKIGYWIAFGAVAGLCCLCRPTFLVTTCLLLLGLALTAWRGRQTLRPVWTAALVVLAVQAPWVLRNWMQLGSPVVATTHGGYTLLLGNNPDYYAHLRTADAGALWRSADLDARLQATRIERDWNELQYDRWANQQARANMSADPTGCALACWHRVRRLWAILPSAGYSPSQQRGATMRYAVAASYGILLALAVIGLLRGNLPWPTRWAIIAFALGFTMLHAFYWCDMRMRGPLAPLLALSAGAAVDAVVCWLWPASRASVESNDGEDAS